MKVAVLMGSPNDMDKMTPAKDTLEQFGVEADVQLHHRMVAYLLVAAALVAGVAAARSRYLPLESKRLALGVMALVTVQALLGIATLMARVPIGLGVAHQLTAALTLALAVTFAWRVRRV